MPFGSLNFSIGIVTSAAGASSAAQTASENSKGISFMDFSVSTDRARELFQRERVQNIARPQPAAPGGDHPVPHAGQMLGMVRIGGNREFRAARFGGADHRRA